MSKEFSPADESPPWERQPRESASAFEAFKNFRKLTPPRFMGDVFPIQTSRIKNWRTKFGWVMRANAWDDHKDARERDEALDYAQQITKGRMHAADGMWKTAIKGLLMWSKYLDDQTASQVMDDGTVKKPPISPTHIQRLAEAGIKLSLLLEGKPTDILDQRHQITVEERRRGMQKNIISPGLRAAMKSVAEIMDSEGSSSDDDEPVH